MEQLNFSDESLAKTHSCGELRAADAGKRVRLCGWVKAYRNFGGVIFISLRDRDGVTQIVFDRPSGARPTRRPRPCTSRRRRCATSGWFRWGVWCGPREAKARSIRGCPPARSRCWARHGILNKSDPVPFAPDDIEEFKDPSDFAKVSEEMRLRYRYVDLRRPKMIRSMRLRHQICRTMRNVLDNAGFIEVETPFLTKSTPKAPRFLVPSRVQQGSFYALPQSPSSSSRCSWSAAATGIPDRPLLPRRGPPGRPPAGIHAARHGDVVHPRGGRDWPGHGD